MGEAIHDGVTTPVRRLARVYEPFHTVGYYAPEVFKLHDEGYRGWWHAYFGYRPAPLGPVGAGVVTAAFYNFAPRMVERAVPSVWDIRSPSESVSRRLELVDDAFRRIFADGIAQETMTTAAQLARRSIEGCDVAGRTLFGGYSDLAWPDEPHLVLWHACTLLREHRGDSHNIALAAHGVSGIDSHVLIAAAGLGNKPTILGIRGWTDDEWDESAEQLCSQGLLQADGNLTAEGKARRSEIEKLTDDLAIEPMTRLSSAEFDTLHDGLTKLVDYLVTTGEISGHWPPPAVIKPAEA